MKIILIYFTTKVDIFIDKILYENENFNVHSFPGFRIAHLSHECTNKIGSTIYTKSWTENLKTQRTQRKPSTLCVLCVKKINIVFTSLKENDYFYIEKNSGLKKDA
jgi:hypothetical protein